MLTRSSESTKRKWRRRPRRHHSTALKDRGRVLELRRMAIEALENMPITSKTVISVANVADKYKVFPDVRNILITKSLSFLNENLKSADDVFTFMMEAKKDFSDNGLELFYD